LQFHPATEPWNIGAFIAIPMTLPNGLVLGAFCAVDPRPRPWSDYEIFVMRALTQSVMTEINLRSKVDELALEQEVRDRFFETITHDLRTPLTAAKLTAQRLKRLHQGSEKEAALADRIVSNMDRADRMIQNLLDANSIKAGQGVSLSFVEQDLAELILATVADLRPGHDNPIEIIDDQGAIAVFCDGEYIRRAVENLISNAIKYGSPEESIRVILHGEKDWVSVSVENRGNPIPLDTQAALFDRYRRSTSATSGTKRGWGIGLTLVRGIATAHKGTVILKSDEQSTVFTLQIPRDPR
ncbi:MAG: HAMP domain-containing histidine kinase, partial [Proteobacteria bacterium]